VSFVGEFLELMDRARRRMRKADWQRVRELGGDLRHVEIVVRECESRGQESEHWEALRKCRESMARLNLPKDFRFFP